MNADRTTKRQIKKNGEGRSSVYLRGYYHNAITIPVKKLYSFMHHILAHWVIMSKSAEKRRRK